MKKSRDNLLAKMLLLVRKKRKGLAVGYYAV